MKKMMIALICACSFSGAVLAQSAADVVIPRPNEVTVLQGRVTIDGSISIVEDNASSEAKYLKNELKSRFGLSVKGSANKAISIKVDESSNLPEEGYTLKVNDSGASIVSSTQKGAFYGIQTLLQLFRAGHEGSTITLDNQEICDEPRFSWRSFMLDECRYFLGQEELYKILDGMAELKMNTLHWHLTDDAGWRVEIKQYPLLTKIGGKRADSEIGTWGSGKTSGEPHEGFYTQKQIKEVLAYAKQRHIKVIPEIEMPGHASAAIAAYPWLGTKGDTIDVPVQFGKLYHTFDVLNPDVVEFLQNVIVEVIELFYTDVIHIGGDEVRFDHWEESEKYQKYKSDKGFDSFMDIQIDFTNNMSKFVEKQGCKMMGWNEILGNVLHADIKSANASTKVADNVIVQFWKGDPIMLAEAAEQGYTLVNSYHVFTYLDYTYKSISLEKAYSFEPVSDGVDDKYSDNIIGLGCQLWREWLATPELVQRNVFPRIAAYAEVGWSDKSNKDYESFTKRLQPVVSGWQSKGINVYVP